MDGHQVVISQSDENIHIRRFKNVLKSTDVSFPARVQVSPVLYSYEGIRLKGLWGSKIGVGAG